MHQKISLCNFAHNKVTFSGISWIGPHFIISRTKMSTDCQCSHLYFMSVHEYTYVVRWGSGLQRLSTSFIVHNISNMKQSNISVWWWQDVRVHWICKRFGSRLRGTPRWRLVWWNRMWRISENISKDFKTNVPSHHITVRE